MLANIGGSILRLRLPAACTFHLRNYLSESYKCNQSWDSRLQPEYMQKINIDTLYYDIEESFEQFGKPSVIDVDIFMNKLSNNVNTDEVTDLLHKLRLTEETSNALPSTGHAVIRSLLDSDLVPDLINILDDRLNYGVFLDHYTANLLLDHLIQKKDFFSAAKIATFLMLQEDFENELSVPLALYACWKYLEDPQPFYPTPEKSGENPSKEEIKVRVPFIRNYYFDDHFDLRDSLQLIGKTMSMIGVKIQQVNMSKNVQFIGTILYQKYDKSLALLAELKTGLYKDVVSICLHHMEQTAEEKLGESGRNLKQKLQNIASDPSLNSENFCKNIEDLIKSTVEKCEKDEISKQEQLYESWIQIRETKLQEEMKRLDRTRRLNEVEKTLQSMKLQEQKLWFFENEEKIDLQIDSKKVFYPKRWFGKKKKPRKVDEGYVPPEIRQKM